MDHTQSIFSTGTLQLDDCSVNFLKLYEIIYGVLPCVMPKKIEDKLHLEYPDLMKTKKK